MWFRERPRTRSWAWDGVHVEAQDKDKVVGMGGGTRWSPRHYKIICEDFVDAKRGCNFVYWESTVKIFKIWVFCIECIIFKIRIFCVKRKQSCVEHHLITRSSWVQWSWWLQLVKEQCCGLGYSSKPTKQGSRRCREEKPLTWVLYETQSKQGVSAWSIGRASRESQLYSSVEQWTSQYRMGLQTSKRMLCTVPFLSKWKENLLRFHSKE